MDSELIERVKAALFDALEKHGDNMECLALQRGRFYINGDFDAREVAKAVIEAVQSTDERA